MHLDFVELSDYISVLEYKSLFTFFWTLKHHKHPKTRANNLKKKKGSQQLAPKATTACKTHAGNFWPAEGLPSNV